MVINLLIPIAGNAKRFVDEGYLVPKPLIMVHDRHMIDWAMSSIKTDNCNLIFLVRKDHISNYSIDSVLRNKFGNDITIVVVDHVTRGTLSTCLLASKYIDNDNPLIIYTPDVYFEPQFDPAQIDQAIDGMLLTFKANSPDHSYVKLNIEGFVEKAVEKSVISNEACVGVYYFKHGKDFVQHGQYMETNEITTNNEFYVCPVYNFLIHKKIKTRLVDKMHVLGTPQDLRFFTEYVLPRFGQKPVALCSDHSGVHIKNTVKNILNKFNIRYIDFGTYTENDCDHYDFLSQSINHIKDGVCDFGISFCRTGQGFNIAANKASGIRSALIFDEFTAEYAIRHNAANYFCFPAKYLDHEMCTKIIETLMRSSFDGGRHATRISKIMKNKDLFNV